MKYLIPDTKLVLTKLTQIKPFARGKKFQEEHRKMEKCYDGAVVMPKNSIVMTKDEMMQVEGGGVGKFIWEFVKVVLYDIGVDLTKKQGKKLWKKAKKWLE